MAEQAVSVANPLASTGNTGVRTQHADYKSMADRWQRCRDVTGGQDAVHNAGERYIPRLKAQAVEDYRAYVMRTPFYNASWRTVAGLCGMLFRKPPAVDVPAGIKGYLDDITASGVPLHVFAQDIAEESLTVGRIGVLVDFPQAAVGGLTEASAKALGLRPMVQSYTAETIINWRVQRINNSMMLTLVVLKESESTFSADGFTETQEDRYRVLDLTPEGQYRVRLFKINDKNEDVQLSESIPLMRGQAISYIPFVFISTDDVTPDIDDPPLIDLFDTNISHYRTMADYENACHFAGSPTAVVSGYTPETVGEKLYIGSRTAWVFPDPATKATYLEVSGTGVPLLENNLQRKEWQMAVLGSRMLEQQKRATETAEVAAVHRMGESSTLASISQTLSMGLTIALKWFADWAGTPGNVLVTLNRDFVPQAMDAPTLTALVQAWQGGAISKEVLFEQLQAGEIIAPDTTFEQEQSRIDIAPPNIGKPDQGQTNLLPQPGAGSGA